MFICILYYAAYDWRLDYNQYIFFNHAVYNGFNKIKYIA